MESDSGLLRWLKLPFLYNVFQAAVGATALRRRLVQNHVRAKAGDKVIDIGCDSAPILQWLPDVEYIGLDINPDCIALAGRTYGTRGTFVVGDRQSVRDDSRFKNARCCDGDRCFTSPRRSRGCTLSTSALRSRSQNFSVTVSSLRGATRGEYLARMHFRTMNQPPYAIRHIAARENSKTQSQ
jgi:hypothetical protein